jgi:hypothetical protein
MERRAFPFEKLAVLVWLLDKKKTGCEKAYTRMVHET